MGKNIGFYLIFQYTDWVPLYEILNLTEFQKKSNFALLDSVSMYSARFEPVTTELDNGTRGEHANDWATATDNTFFKNFKISNWTYAHRVIPVLMFCHKWTRELSIIILPSIWTAKPDSPTDLPQTESLFNSIYAIYPPEGDQFSEKCSLSTNSTITWLMCWSQFCCSA